MVSCLTERITAIKLTLHSLSSKPMQLHNQHPIPTFHDLTLSQPNRLRHGRPDRRWRYNGLCPHWLRPFHRGRLHSRRAVRTGWIPHREQTTLRCGAGSPGQCRAGGQQYTSCDQVGQAIAYWIECFGDAGIVAVRHGVVGQDEIGAAGVFIMDGWMDVRVVIAPQSRQSNE